MTATTRPGMPRSGSVSAADASGGISSGGSMSEAQRQAQRRRQARAAKAPERIAKTAARNAVLAARRKPTGFHSGEWIRTDTPGCRPFDNRIGVVVTNNLGEVGVGFGFDWSIQLPSVDAWFRPEELERVR